ncbi:MAG: hypothetical protein ACLSTO_02740 [Bilophila wadsworthia]
MEPRKTPNRTPASAPARTEIGGVVGRDAAVDLDERLKAAFVRIRRRRRIFSWVIGKNFCPPNPGSRS